MRFVLIEAVPVSGFVVLVQRDVAWCLDPGGGFPGGRRLLLTVPVLGFFCAGARRRPGCAPGSAPTFLASPRKVGKRRRPNWRAWLRQVPCAARWGRGHAQTRFAQTSACPDPSPPALLSPPDGTQGDVTSLRSSRISFFAFLFPSLPSACRDERSEVPSPEPCGAAEHRSGGWIRARACLSEASLRVTPSAARSAGNLGRRPRLRLRRAFFCFLFLAKQEKEVRCRAHIPA
ncbi:MAG: hypothetical protein GAK30_01054 [Paracidovorax wautersii]|uniref:Uncharacterized protein n=1 Tax=Paracidovorax wautersii TaxID=1177982 RepID=A0A7V8FQS9_9BURK|nr:MAG: hypothetical protein GAK30_01054 [Paracidovorax wautersii]